MSRRFASVVVAVVLAVMTGVVLGAPSLLGQGSSTAADTRDASSEPQVTAYYFHTNYRCTTCRTIEAYSEEAIRGAFADDLAAGRLRWRAVNVEQLENKHFIQDFQLVTKSLVLVEERDGDVVRFKNLDRVWQLVRDKQRFLDYVHSETRDFMATR